MSSPKLARLVPQPDGTQPEEVMHISSFVLAKRGAQLLLARRVKPERWAGKWVIPGAIINYGEDPGAGALRVIRDQLGATATVLKLLDVQSYGDRHWDMCFVFHADIPGVGKLAGDFDKSDYFDLDKLPPELREDHKEVLDMAKSRKVVQTAYQVPVEINFKPLGSGARVSEVGMGTYYDPQWIATAKTIGWRRGAGPKVEALKAGLDGGMNFIDTAELYGSEPLVAQAIKGRKREDLFIATKVWPNHLRRDALVRALEKSLKRLETSYVDLYQVHFPNTRVPIGETMAAMEEMKDKGKLLSIGVSNFSLQQTKDAVTALKKSELASNQVEYSLANREIEADLLPYCESNKISVICYYPLGHGKLTGSKAGGRMEAACKAYAKTPAQVALNWLVSGRNVFAIPRASRVDHVKEDLGASGWELRPQDRAQLDAAFPR